MITSFFKVKEGKGGAAAAAPSSKRGQKSTAAAGGAGAEAVEEDAVEEVSVEAEGGSRGAFLLAVLLVSEAN